MEAYKEALPLYQRSLEIKETALGKDHLEVAIVLSSIAGLYQDMGAYEEALPLFQRSLELGEQALGKDHPSVVIIENTLAELSQGMTKH